MNPYLNFFFVLGLAIGIPATLFLLRNLFRLLSSLARRRRWERYTERSAADGYQEAKDLPAHVQSAELKKHGRRVRWSLAFVVLAAVLLIPGLYLSRFTPFMDSTVAGKVRSFRDTPGHIVVMIQAPGREWVTTGSMPGNYWSVRGQFIVFDERLEVIGLVAYQRIEGVLTIGAKEDLFVQGKAWTRDLIPKDRIFRLLLEYNGKIPLVKVFEQSTVYRPPSRKDVDFMAARTGYVILG
jgi:hypothetical protein